ncbi:hypothetical protein EUGRSUZ_F04088 [Eucalyptus grandis]|uniref:Uncharacterized protein n=2 Tax=Eucalyptus grandis TaxID=71139 RepID=A0ACC3KPL3_EUCGR|nr:hypothetical protein EUGRSUZ_F04088 [Eucalyptus grandis]
MACQEVTLTGRCLSFFSSFFPDPSSNLQVYLPFDGCPLTVYDNVHARTRTSRVTGNHRDSPPFWTAHAERDIQLRFNVNTPRTKRGSIGKIQRKAIIRWTKKQHNTHRSLDLRQ